MMQHEGHVRILKSLKLFGMAHAIEELGNQNSGVAPFQRTVFH